MASITRDPKTKTPRIQFTFNGKRKTIRLGKVSKKVAATFRTRVEHLIAARSTGSAPDLDTCNWLNSLPDEMHAKLSRTGLVEAKGNSTLGPFIDSYMRMRKDVKPATLTVWGHTRRNLAEFFGAGRMLRSITPGDAEEWRLHLIGEDLSEATIRKRCGFAKQFFAFAEKKGLVDANPFADLKSAAMGNPDRFYFVNPEDADKVIEACPDHEWRLIVALARYGGLRCPSEVFALTWNDIDWERSRMRVTSPKTEHHEGKGSRMVPLFPELVPLLLEASERAEPGTVHVITRHRNRTNLRTRFKKIIKRAGLTPWPKLFQNLRSTRQTELEDLHPSHVVCAWIGNSEQVARKHYLQVTDEHFDRAANPRDAKSDASVTHNPTQHAAAEIRTDPRCQKETPVGTGVMPTDARGCDPSQNGRMEDRGLEPLTFWLPARRSPN